MLSEASNVRILHAFKDMVASSPNFSISIGNGTSRQISVRFALIDNNRLVTVPGEGVQETV